MRRFVIATFAISASSRRSRKISPRIKGAFGPVFKEGTYEDF
jgi:hypothetical protein